MKKIYLLLMVLWVMQSKSASAQAINIDSLIRLNNAYLKEDTFKMDLLVKIAYEYRKTNAAKGITTAEQAITMAQNLKKTYWEAKALYTKAVNNMVTAANTDAIDIFKKIIPTFEALKKPHDLADAYLSLSMVYNTIGKMPEAREYCNKALEVNTTIGNQKGQADCILHSGLIYRSNGDFNNALSNDEKAIRIYEQLNEKASLAHAYKVIGSVYQDWGNYEKVLEYDQKALAINLALNNQNLVATNYGDIALTYRSMGDLPKALEYYQKSLKLSETLNNKNLIAYNYDKMGSLYRDLLDFPKAFDYYQKAITINQEAGNLRNVGINYGNIGNAHFMQGNYPQAIIHHEKALTYFEPMSYKFGILATNNNLGGVYEAIPNHAKALEYFKKGLALSKEMNIKAYQLTSLSGIGRVYLNGSDEVLLKEGVDPANRFPKAIESLKEALKLSQDLKRVDDIGAGWQSLSVAYEKKGDFINAYEAYKNYIIFRDSATGDEVKKQITRKEIQYEYDKKEAALKFEQQLTAEQLERQKLISKQQEQALILNKQTLNLKEQALIISNKEKDLQHLAYLKEKAEKQQKEEELILAEKDKQLQTSQLATLVKEKALQVQTLAKKNALIGFLLASVTAILLGFTVFYLWQRQKELKKKAAIQAEFTQQLLENIEEERGRIAIDLHDSISHELLSLKRGLKPEYTEGVAQKIDGIIDDIRQISRNLHPVLLDKIGLKLSIETLCEQYGEHETLFVTHNIDYDKPLPKPAELQVFRIIQEALNNTVKYAQANASNITMTHTTEGLVFEIKDNGKGFDVQKALSSGKSFGLHSILQRSKAINGKATIQSSEQGTNITVTIPQQG